MKLFIKQVSVYLCASLVNRYVWVVVSKDSKRR